MKMLSVLVLLLATGSFSSGVAAKADDPQVKEFLGVKLGVPLATQFPPCGDKFGWKSSTRCHVWDPQTGYGEVYWCVSTEDSRCHGDSIIVGSEGAGSQNVGSLSHFEPDPFPVSLILMEIEAKLGKAKSCEKGAVQNRFGAVFETMSCKWAPAWGSVNLSWTNGEGTLVSATSNATIERMLKEPAKTTPLRY